MKAVQVHAFGGPEALEVCEIAVPRPREGEVLVRVRAAGVNPYDTYMRAGEYGSRNPPLPFIPGSDAAGVVEALGPGTEGTSNGIRVGARVYTTGTQSGAYAEFAVCRLNQVHALPDNVTFAQGAAVYVPYATAYRSLFQLARVKPGETVLVHGGSGGVGLSVIQFARSRGLRIFATAGSAHGLQLIVEQGAERAFDHHSSAYQDEILAANNGRGVDVIIEVLANVNLARDVRLLADRGRIVVVGSRGDVQITPRELMFREATVTGVLIWRMPPADAAEIPPALQAGLRDGTLRPIIAAELPLADAPEAHRRILQSGARGKIVLVP